MLKMIQMFPELILLGEAAQVRYLVGSHREAWQTVSVDAGSLT